MQARYGIFIAFIAGIALSYCCCSNASSGTAGNKDSLPVFASYIRDSTCTVDSLELDFYIPVNAHAAFTDVRPLKADSNVILVCAAAFTRLDNGRIDGLSMVDGKVITRPVNHSLGGGIIIPPADSAVPATIFGTDMGKILDSSFVDSVCGMKASFFQQIQMVRDGQALPFHKESSLFQRRAICIWHNQVVIVETKGRCTLQKFADVLKSCRINNALYVDMGSWDEGWFRDQHYVLHSIGLMRNETDRQSNWFVFRTRH